MVLSGHSTIGLPFLSSIPQLPFTKSFPRQSVTKMGRQSLLILHPQWIFPLLEDDQRQAGSSLSWPQIALKVHFLAHRRKRQK